MKAVFPWNKFLESEIAEHSKDFCHKWQVTFLFTFLLIQARVPAAVCSCQRRAGTYSTLLSAILCTVLVWIFLKLNPFSPSWFLPSNNFWKWNCRVRVEAQFRGIYHLLLNCVPEGVPVFTPSCRVWGCYPWSWLAPCVIILQFFADLENVIVSCLYVHFYDCQDNHLKLFIIWAPSFCMPAHLRDIAGLVPDHCNKVNTTIK